ncbi:MAG: ATP-binding cassette domain-containing protein, partial [Betaproteobacteria bacterium]
MLNVENLSKTFGGVSAMNGVSLDFTEGSLTAIIGPNGAGKTTFFNLITGAFRPDSGRILLGGEDIAGLTAPEIVRKGIGRGFQIASIFPSFTVRDAILGAVNAHRGWHAKLARRFPLAGAQTQAGEIMDLVGLGARADVLSGNLSHGEQKLL